MEDQVVRSSWTKFFKMKKIKFFQIHDGGYISEKIDLDELEKFVLDDIGINIKIEMNDLWKKPANAGFSVCKFNDTTFGRLIFDLSML